MARHEQLSIGELWLGAPEAKKIDVKPEQLNLLATETTGTQALTAAGAVSLSVKETTLATTTAGAKAITIAAPGAGNPNGQEKIIRAATISGGGTFTLVNQPIIGHESQTGTFDAAGDTLILKACGNKWAVVGNNSVAFA